MWDSIPAKLLWATGRLLQHAVEFVGFANCNSLIANCLPNLILFTNHEWMFDRKNSVSAKLHNWLGIYKIAERDFRTYCLHNKFENCISQLPILCCYFANTQGAMSLEHSYMKPEKYLRDVFGIYASTNLFASVWWSIWCCWGCCCTAFSASSCADGKYKSLD